MPGDGFGAVGRAELGQELTDVLLNCVEGDHELSAMAWFDLPAASGEQAAVAALAEVLTLA